MAYRHHNAAKGPTAVALTRPAAAPPTATLARPPGPRSSIFEADLPSELYAYRPGRNAQQAVVEVEERLFRGHPDVVDADLADYLDVESYCPRTHAG